MYDLSHGSEYCCLFEMNVQQSLQRYWEQKEISTASTQTRPLLISSQPSWKKESVPDDVKESATALEPGTAVLGIFFIRNQQQPAVAQNDVGIHEVLFGSQSGAAIK